MKRKITTNHAYTSYVSLPAAFVKKHGLNQRDLLEVVEGDNSITYHIPKKGVEND